MRKKMALLWMVLLVLSVYAPAEMAVTLLEPVSAAAETEPESTTRETKQAAGPANDAAEMNPETAEPMDGTGMMDSAQPTEPAALEPLPTARPYPEPMDGRLRVWLQSLGERSALGLTLAGVYTVDGDRGFQFQKNTEIRLGVVNGGILLQVGGATIDMGGGFTLTRHLDGDGNTGGVFIHESEKDTLYCGDIAISAIGGDRIRVIVLIGVEDYLLGVLPYEMSDTFPLEALKAQAVAARSYAMQRKARNVDQDYDIVDTVNDQVYKGLDARFEKPIQAVQETYGIVGMDHGKVAELFYSASNGGQTAQAKDVWGRGEFPYLDIHDDPYDLENVESVVKTAKIERDAGKLAPQIAELLLTEVESKLIKSRKMKAGDTAVLVEIQNVEAVKPVYKGKSRQYGTIRFTVQAAVIEKPAGMEVSDETNSVEKPAVEEARGEAKPVKAPIVVELSFYDQVRAALNIAINTSTYDLIEVREEDDGFILTNRRYGHGVGLSQRGAQQMAGKHQMDYLSILRFYYPGLDLAQVQWIEKEVTPADALPESLGYAAPRPTPVPPPKPLPPLSEGEYYAVVIVEGVDSTLNVREEPSIGARILGVLRNNTRMIVEEETEDGWAKMKTMEIEGYVSMSFIVREGERPAEITGEGINEENGDNEETGGSEGIEETGFVF